MSSSLKKDFEDFDEKMEKWREEIKNQNDLMEGQQTAGEGDFH